MFRCSVRESETFKTPSNERGFGEINVIWLLHNTLINAYHQWWLFTRGRPRVLSHSGLGSGEVKPVSVFLFVSHMAVLPQPCSIPLWLWAQKHSWPSERWISAHVSDFIFDFLCKQTHPFISDWVSAAQSTENHVHSSFSLLTSGSTHWPTSSLFSFTLTEVKEETHLGQLPGRAWL